MVFPPKIQIGTFSSFRMRCRSIIIHETLTLPGRLEAGIEFLNKKKTGIEAHAK
jgi:hypothetical protein